MIAAIRLFLGGLPGWLFATLAGAVAAGGIIWGIFHAGEADARVADAKAIAASNLKAAQDAKTAQVKAEADFEKATEAAVTAQIAADKLKQEVIREAQGNASPGCRAAIVGILQHSGIPQSAAKLPGHKSPVKPAAKAAAAKG